MEKNQITSAPSALAKKNSNPLKRVEREVVTAQNLLWTKMIGPLLSFIAIKASTTSPPVP